MKITTANGKLSVTLNREEWTQMGQAMGWLAKTAKAPFDPKALEEKKPFDPKKKPVLKEGDEEKEACPCAR